MCSTEKKETRQGKRQGSVRVSNKGRRNKREQRNKKPKNKRKGLHKDRNGDFKGFIFCEFASAWRLGANSQNMSNMGKEEKQGRTRRSNEIMVFQIANYKCTRVHYIYTRKKGNKSSHFLLLVRTIFVPLHIGKKSVQKQAPETGI